MDIQFSKELFDKAVADHDPYAIVMMFSGGDDSLTAYHIARELGINIDLVIHGVTGTGLNATRQFVHQEVTRLGDKLIEADAGKAYEKYVLRKGFFGLGDTAHEYSYHVLKSEHFSKAVSKHIRKRKHNRKIFFLNGARRKESDRRKKTMEKPIRISGNDIWVNIINEADKKETIDYLEGNAIKRNPVSVQLCKSGECMCGTMQSHEQRAEAKHIDPVWGDWLDDLEKEVLKKFPWKWGESIPKAWTLEKHGQQRLFDYEFRPMCHSCKLNY